MGPPTMAHSWCVLPLKISSWSAKYFSKDLIFLSIRLESPIHAPKISVFLEIYPHNLGAHRSDPQKALLCVERRVLSFEPSLIQIWRTVRPVALAKKTKNRNKRQWQTGYSPRPPTSPYRCQSLHAGWRLVYSSIFQLLLKSVQWFCRCGWSKIALSHYFGHWLSTACTTVQAVIIIISLMKSWKNATVYNMRVK